MDIQVAVKLYLSSIENDTTRRCYRAALEQYTEYLEHVDQITPRTIQSYKMSLRDKSAQTICARLAAIRGLSDLCWTKGWLDTDPSLFVGNVSNPRYTKFKEITSRQFRKILNNINLDCDGIHDYLLLKLIYISGKPESVARLNWNAKLPRFAEKLKEEYKASAKADPDLKIKDSGHLFFPFAFNNTLRLTDSELLNILKDRAVYAGYERNQFDIMSLKRLRSKEVYEETGSVEAVQKLCGFKYRKDAVRFVKTL